MARCMFSVAGVDHRPVETASRVVTKRHGEQLRGEAIVIVTSRSRRHPHRIFERGGGADDPFEMVAVCRGHRRTSVWNRPRLPASAEPFGRFHECREVDRTRRHQHDVSRTVTAAVILPHRLHGQRLDRFNGAEHAARQGVLPEERRPATVVGAKRRLVVIHADLFEDDEFLRGEVLLPQGRPHHAGQEIHRLVLLRWQHGGMVDGVFLTGERIRAGAHPVEPSVDLVGRQVGRALEHHVFEEVARPPEVVALVPGAGADEKTDARGKSAVGHFGDDIEPVVEAFMQKPHHAPPRVPGRVIRPRDRGRDASQATPRSTAR